MILRLLRIANPFVRAVLRSPAHPLLSRSLALLEYEGRRTRRTFAIPVLYAENGESFVVLAAMPDRKRWWKTFRAPAPATLLVRGQRRPVEGRLLSGRERRDAVRVYLARFPRTTRPLGISHATDSDLDRASAAVVAFTPRGT